MSVSEEDAGVKRRGEEQNQIQSDEEISDVHSANNWEKANLGDENRRQKFLRLLGAGKKEHHGKIVIGDNITAHPSEKSPEAITRDLEEQYEQGQEHKRLSFKRTHVGLGFHDEDEEAVEKENADEEKLISSKNDTNPEKESRSEPSREKDGKVSDAKKVKFVKESS